MRIESPSARSSGSFSRSFSFVAKSFAFGGENVQRELLEKEGIVFKPDGTVDLKKYGWFG